MSQTKYELAAELRALTRGMKRPQICKMKKHELEEAIDRIKVLKQLETDIGEYPPTKPGPLGPRPISVAATADGISVPQAPAKHFTEATKPSKKSKFPMKIGDTVSVHFDDADDEKPVVPVATSVRAHPTKALPSSSGVPPARSSSKISLPAAPRRTHTCNCPACPEKTIAA